MATASFPSPLVDEKVAVEILGITPGTLSVWRQNEPPRKNHSSNCFQGPKSNGDKQLVRQLRSVYNFTLQLVTVGVPIKVWTERCCIRPHGSGLRMATSCYFAVAMDLPAK